MNILEHYIEKIHSIEDISSEFETKIGYPPHEQLLKVDLTYDCYGQKKRDNINFYKSEWEDVKEKGYFMA